MKESQLSAEVELLQSSDKPQRVSRSPISMNFEVSLGNTFFAGVKESVCLLTYEMVQQMAVY